MIRFTAWKPKEWHPVVVTWERINNDSLIVAEWLKNTEGGRYFYDGWSTDEGLTFLFEEETDAVLFKLRWI
jgi:hypothetical protein